MKKLFLSFLLLCCVTSFAQTSKNKVSKKSKPKTTTNTTANSDYDYVGTVIYAGWGAEGKSRWELQLTIKTTTGKKIDFTGTKFKMEDLEATTYEKIDGFNDKKTKINLIDDLKVGTKVGIKGTTKMTLGEIKVYIL